MNKTILTCCAALAVAASQYTDAASIITLNFGNGELNADSIGDRIPLGVPGAGELWAFSVGGGTSNVTGMPAGLSFDVTVFTVQNGSVGGTFSSQSNGIGLAGGSAAGGFDNGTAGSAVDEGFLFLIENVQGLGVGESLHISGFGLTFIQLANGDSWEVNSDGVVTATADGDVLVEPVDQALDALINARSNPSSLDDRGTGTNNTRLGLGSLQLTVVPEPSSLTLIGLGGLALLARRRR